VLLVVVFPERPLLVVVLLWWGKPVYEPLLLFWLSRAVFDERPGFGVMRRQWRIILRSQPVANLVWRRLSPNRSFYMPVAVLEGLRGASRRARVAVLGRGQRAGLWLTLVAYHFELVLQFSALLLVLIMLPEEADWLAWQELLVEPTAFGAWLGAGVELLVMSVIAPFYVAGGFALYLTRRTELEAWDIEISFRRMNARLAQGARPDGAVLSALVLLPTLGLMLHPTPLRAHELQPEAAREVITQVLGHEDFGRIERVPYWKYAGKGQDESEQPADGLVKFFELLTDLFRGFSEVTAEVAEALLWGLLGLLIGYLVYRIGRNRARLPLRTPAARQAAAAPVSLSGLNPERDGLPRDVAEEASRLAQQGRPREALSLLYRGAVVALLQSGRLEIPHSATEAECLALVDRARPEPEVALFRRLTSAWLRLAYAHRSPPAHELEALCREWGLVYGIAHEP
jgi:hypothetical protein